MAAFETGLLGDGGDDTNRRETAAKQSDAAFQPPALGAIPDDENGAAIRRGMAIFLNTKTNAGDFVGNDLACVNCHLDAGRKPGSAPMWAAWVVYPKYRSKNGKINTMEDRLKGCFTYSMNGQGSPSGGPPPVGSDVYRDLEIYFRWLATGAPTGEKMKGAGYPKLKKTDIGYDPARGAKVFEQNCASCHGADGQGQRDINGRIVFPPLWGSGSYNWGAGMARVNTAAAFIKENMPLGQENRLTDQQAWDVAAFIDSHERPRDPRQTGSVEATAKAHHGGESYYGKTLNGRLLGTGTSGS
ncbi:c-type cytochrome [Sphingomonadaceae bacterium LXI357]|uniref:C-type cytochrome n=2 Tax=Stakelama marina TaxID=2826939 RepID=A0A8T4IK82_9SPHN|nr:c-type cytochrome [Stakelama marina]